MKQNDTSPALKSIYIRSISNGQLQLPASLVSEVGYLGDQLIYRGAEVVWYYHPASDRAVLSNKQVDQDGLEEIRSVKITGVSNEELQTTDPTSGRVTVPTDLPDDIHDAITSGDEVVLVPLYESRQSSLSSTCVIVRPAAEFYHEHLSSDQHDPFPTPLDPEVDKTDVAMDLSNSYILPNPANRLYDDAKVRCVLK